MSLHRLALAAVVALSACCQTGGNLVGPVAKEAPAVRRVHGESWGGEWYGTAFHVGDGRWVTAGHVCRPDSTFTVGEATATVLAVSERDDLCVLEAEPTAVSLELRVDRAQLGERLHYIGYPKLHYGVYEGVYSGTNDGEPMFSAIAYGGASGAPVLDTRGRVVGVLVSGILGHPFTYFEPARDVRAILARAR